MSIEDLQAEGDKLLAEFTEEFEAAIRKFYKGMVVYAAKLESSDAKPALRAALATTMLAGLERMGSITDRVAEEEGIK